MPDILADGRRRRILVLSLLALGQATAAGVSAIAVRELFTALGGDSAPMPSPALAALLAAGCLVALLRWSERVAAERLGQDYAAAVRLALFSHLASLPLGEVARRRAGTLSLRFVGDLSAIRAWVSQGLARMISSAIVLPVVAAVLFVLDPRIGVAASACALIGLVAMALLGPGLRRAHSRLRRRRARLSGNVAERLPHAPELRLMGRLGLERKRLAEHSRRMIAAAMQRQWRSALVRAIPELSQAVAAVLVLWIALDSDMATGDAAAALAALALLILPLRDLSGVWDRQAAWRTARQRCESLFATAPMPGIGPNRERASSGHKRAVAVRFDQVSHGLLDRISATAMPGQKIGITGANGSGKSTLLMLAAGLEAPTAGRVRIDGVRAERWSIAGRRQRLFYLGQRTPVLAGSLRRALTLGLRPRPADDVIVAAAARCRLNGLMQRLGGLDGRLNEGGRNLSAGELQRVLLTRAALSAAPALLLDEPDDALDYSGRQLLANLLRGLESTVLCVSHDWSTLRLMDEVWFLDGGRIVERGSPEALQHSAGPTARLFGLSQDG